MAEEEMTIVARTFMHGKTDVVTKIPTFKLAKQIFAIIKERSYFDAVYFWEQFKFFRITGKLM